jgi:hypothetical protein
VTDESKPTHCPECRSPRTAPINYGLVEEFDEALERDLGEGKYVLGGDIIFPDAARWACLACDHRWDSFWFQFDPTVLAGIFKAKRRSDAPCDQASPRARIALQELGLSSLSLNCLRFGTSGRSNSKRCGRGLRRSFCGCPARSPDTAQSHPFNEICLRCLANPKNTGLMREVRQGRIISDRRQEILNGRTERSSLFQASRT